MQAYVMFTRSSKIGSKLIREITGEPVSHCAIYVPSFGFVWHSTIPTITALSLAGFEETHVIYDWVPVVLTEEQFTKMRTLKGSYYDFFSFFYIGLRLLFRKINISLPKADLRKISGAFLCTEFVQTVVGIENDPYMTPFKLYKVLKLSTK